MPGRDAVSRRGFLNSTGRMAVVASCCLLCRRGASEDPAPKKPGADEGKLEFKPVAACGIYCGACVAFVDSLDAKEPKGVKCAGCLTDRVPEWSCGKCKVRPCAMGKKLESCASCKDHPCDKLKEVFKWAKDAPDNLKRIADKGMEEFKKEMKARWSCKKCGAAFSQKDKKCRKCAEPVQPGK